MNKITRLLGLLTLVAVAALACASSTAAATATYHGVFTGAVAYEGCTTQPPANLASGTWNVVVRASGDAVLAVNIFSNGSHHVSFGAPVTPADAGGSTFAFQLQTLAGALVVRLDGTTFTYAISPYDAFGLTCDSVTYYGLLTR